MKKIVRGKTILTLSTGNMKLQGDEEKTFLIWNILAEVTCPYRTRQCTKYCYAKKAEKLYPSVKMSRTEQTADSKDVDFIENMQNTIEYYMNKKALKGKKIYFRIHESGDFYSQNYFDSWVKISELFPDITFMAYTKSVKYVRDTELEIPGNLVIRYSVWDDTKQEQIEIANKLQLPIFTAFTAEEMALKVENENYIKCDCDCKVCKNCYSGAITKIAVTIH